MSTKTAQHLYSYNAVREPVDFALEFSAVQYVYAMVLNALISVWGPVSSLGPVAGAADAMDARADKALSSLDKAAPQLVSFSFVKTYRSVVERAQAFWNGIFAYTCGVHAQVCDRAHAVLAPLAPLGKAANDYYQYVLDVTLPAEKRAEREFSSELARAGSLLQETFDRIGKLAQRVSAIPAHVSEVYAAESKDKSATVAVTNTTHKLSQEAYSTVRPMVDRIVGQAGAAQTQVQTALGGAKSTGPAPAAPATAVDATVVPIAEISPALGVTTTGVEVR